MALRSINASEVLGVVGSTKDLHEVGKTIITEDERDYTKKIKELIKRAKKAQREEGDKTPGDITEHAIEQSLDKAFKNAKLQVFESFLGENWSSERLRVMILDRVDAEMGRLFHGNNRGNAPMDELDNLIQRAAESVYRRIFETSEFLAANRGSALFVQRLYQTHGGLVDDQLREVTDRMITSASNLAITRFDGAHAKGRQWVCPALSRATHRPGLPVRECRSHFVVGPGDGNGQRNRAEDRLHEHDDMHAVARKSIRHREGQAQSAEADAAAGCVVGDRTEGRPLHVRANGWIVLNVGPKRARRLISPRRASEPAFGALLRILSVRT